MWESKPLYLPHCGGLVSLRNRLNYLWLLEEQSRAVGHNLIILGILPIQSLGTVALSNRPIREVSKDDLLLLCPPAQSTRPHQASFSLLPMQHLASPAMLR